MHLRYIVPRDWSVGQLNVRDVCDCETEAFSNTGGTPMKVVQGLSVSLTAGVVRKFCKKKNTLTNIESIPRIRNLANVHTYKEQKLRKAL